MNEQIVNNNELIPCPDCGKMVPELNLQLHVACACPGRARIAQQNVNEEPETAVSSTSPAATRNVTEPTFDVIDLVGDYSFTVLKVRFVKDSVFVTSLCS